MPFKLNALTGKFDLVQDLSGHVPYTGATTNLDMGVYDFATTDLDASGATTLNTLQTTGISTLYLPTGTDNSVLIKDADGSIRTDEIDSRVWGSTLMNLVNGENNRVITATDSNSGNGEANLTFDSSTLTVGGGAGNIRTDDGTDRSPSYSFTNEPDTGMSLIIGEPSNLVWTIDGRHKLRLSDKALYPYLDDGVDLGLSGNRWGDLYFHPSSATSNTVLVIQGSGQVTTDVIDSKVWGTDLISGGGANTQIAYYSSAEVITGSSNFFYDGALNLIKTTTGVGVKLYSIVDSTGTAGFNYYKAQAGPAVNPDGVVCGAFNIKSYDSTDFKNIARFVASTDGASSAGSTPGRWDFYTTPNGSTTSVINMTIRRGGNIEFPHDNQELKIGGGLDMSISYTGTYAKIVTDNVAASDLVIDCGTNKTVELAEVVWDDYVTPLGPNNWNGVSNNPTLTKLFDDGSGSQGVYGFVFTNGDEAIITIQMPHKWKEGTTIYPHIHFMCTSDVDPTDKFGIEFEYTWADINEDFTANSTLSTIDVETGVDTDNMHRIANVTVAGISGSGHTISSVLLCRIKRVAATGDDYADGIAILDFDVHYEIDTIGSRQISAK